MYWKEDSGAVPEEGQQTGELQVASSKRPGPALRAFPHGFRRLLFEFGEEIS